MLMRHFSLSTLVCSSMLHPNLLHPVPSQCVLSLFCSLPLNPVCPAPGSHFSWPRAICLQLCSSVSHSVSFSRPLLSYQAWVCQHFVTKLLLCKSHCTSSSSLSLLSMQNYGRTTPREAKVEQIRHRHLISWRNCCHS